MTDPAGGLLLPDGPEQPYLAYWARNLVDHGDPQRDRWLALELAQGERNAGVAAEVARFAPLDGARVLDVGCQTGALPIAMARLGADVVGVDVTPALLAGAAIRARCHGVSPRFVCARAEHLPFASDTFDVVTFVDVIEHVDNARAAVRELSRVLRRGGVLYLFGPNRLSPSLFVSDPHYQLAGVSVLPHALGQWYVTRLRAFPRYDVGTLPVGGMVARWLRADGLTVIHSAVNDADRWWAHRTPAALHGLRSVARAWGALRMSLAPLFCLVARKH